MRVCPKPPQLPSRSRSAISSARLLSLMATMGCSGPKLFSSIASARRINGSASLSRLVATEQLSQVVEAVATLGCSGPKLFSSMANARRISGSASMSRLVACSRLARLLSLMATMGCSGPKLFSSIASARRISGSASASRLVLCSNWQGCEGHRDLRMFGPEALLVDSERTAIERLGLNQPLVPAADWLGC